MELGVDDGESLGSTLGDALGVEDGALLGALLSLGDELGAGLLLGIVLGMSVGQDLVRPNGEGVLSKVLHKPMFETPHGSELSITISTFDTNGTSTTTFVTLPAPSRGATMVVTMLPPSVVTITIAWSTMLTSPNSTTSVMTGSKVKVRVPEELASGTSKFPEAGFFSWTTMIVPAPGIP